VKKKITCSSGTKGMEWKMGVPKGAKVFGGRGDLTTTPDWVAEAGRVSDISI